MNRVVLASAIRTSTAIWLTDVEIQSEQVR